MICVENYHRLRAEIPAQVTIVLAAKTRTPEEVAAVIAAGATDLGENYVQEAETMFNALGEQARAVRWHMIGALQTNKINKALSMFNLFQTLDSLHQAVALDKRAARFRNAVPIYLEVNIGSEVSKTGLPAEYAQIEQTARAIAALEHVRLEGLMTMGPLSADPEESRPYYRATKQIFDQLAAQEIPNVALRTLSMGMSDTYRIAIEEGANMVRLGTIVFGARAYAKDLIAN